MCDVLGADEEFNQSLEKAGRVADFFELAELMCLDALERNESCGGHFREEYQTPEGEALRDDEHFSYVAAWELPGCRRASGAAQRAAGLRIRASLATELQVDEPHSSRLAAEERRRSRPHGPLRGARRQSSTCRFWRCWTC